jgi:chromatin segregation and condensation protein Rec8/ScpA/Scc1 (kleisin family)
MVKFKDLLKNDASDDKDVKYDKIVTFISILEMVKTRVVKVKQDGNFSEIEIEPNMEKES